MLPYSAIRKGFSFGLTSGIITTLGMIVGLNATTNSRLAVIGGILIIAVADSMSDALGVHISEEASHHHTNKEVWQSTLATFGTKFIFALTFIVPFIFLDIFYAIIFSVIWGLGLIMAFSYTLGKEAKDGKVFSVIFEHLSIAVIVVILTNYLGNLIRYYFK